jgi:low temperature requirement protein LtrA
MPTISRGRESTVSDAELLLSEPTIEEEERTTSYLELFFDLIFVFAFTQVALLILEDTSAPGFARSALVLALVWWAWSAYTWMTNAIDIESLVVRFIVLAAMAAAFFMALAVPDAYQDEGVRFAFAYFVVRVLHIALFGWGVRDDPGQRRALLRLAPWFLGAALVVLAGGFVDGDARAYIWLGALMIDVAGTLAPAQAGFRVSASHFAERFALIVIIALGESIVAIGVATTDLDRDWAFAAEIAIAFAGVAALWWSYFDFTAIAAERSLKRAPPEVRAPLARDVFTFFHYPIVLGIILYAVAAKKTLTAPGEPLSESGRWALGLGIAVFFLGFVLARYRALRRVAWERIVGGAAALIAAVTLDGTNAIVTLSIVITILIASVALETVRLRELRAEVKTG